MRFVLFYHSLVSDWNHGNAHFLRGIVRELKRREHEVVVLEPRDGWSRRNLEEEIGREGMAAFERELGQTDCVELYDPADFDPSPWLEDADVAIVHEWTEPDLVARIGESRNGGRLLFHDTHHRAVSAPEEMERYDLSSYDGALVFGQSLKEEYHRRGWTERAWVWHEAADTARFFPHTPADGLEGDLVWIGNWGDGERSKELETYLFEPAKALALQGSVYGVRYPDEARRLLQDSGLSYRGWLPNHRAPEVFARYRLTAHIPRRYYAEVLPGIPTIRVFEALACGIPLICAPWDDAERLFRPGEDYLVARDGREMAEAMRSIATDAALAASLRASGLDTILSRHTCRHRVDELLTICGAELDAATAATPVANRNA